MKAIFPRAALLGVLIAAGAFTYALATGNGEDDGAGTRSTTKPGHGTVGTNPRAPLVFTNALLGGTAFFDLGDAAVGSAITRHVTAKGGMSPRRFTSDHTNTEFMGKIALQDAINTLPAGFNPGASTAVLQLNGILAGQIGGAFPGTTSATPLDFDVTVTDSKSLESPDTLTSTYQLTMVDSTVFKFAQTLLHDGVAFGQYHEKIEVIAGHKPYNITVSNITVTDPTTGIVTPYATLDQDLGLFLNPKSGDLVGRPLVAGRYSFLCNCTDKSGAQALSRDKSSVGQVLSFNITPTTRVEAALFALKITIKGNIQTAGKDSIKYSGVIDLAGNSISSLNNSGVTLTIGQYTSPTVTIQGGKGTTGKGVSPSMSVVLSSTGEITITISNESFGTAGTIVSAADLVNSQKVLAANLTVGTFFDSNELLRFGVRARSANFELDYKFGPGNLGGGFLISQVTGKDDTKSSTDADTWAVQFITVPHTNQKLDNSIATATVGIGTDFTDTIPVALKNTTFASTQQRDPTQADLVKFVYNDQSGKGAYITGPLPKTSTQSNVATNIPESINANGKFHRFATIITFNRADATQTEAFGAEGARAIFPKGTTWIDKNLAK